MKPRISPILAWVASSACVAVSVADAPAIEEPPATAPAASVTPRDSAGDHAKFASLYKPYAQQYVPYGDDYACLLSYDPRLPSSRGVTVDAILDDRGWTVEVPGPMEKSRPRKKRMTIPRADAEVGAMALPELAPGHYGYARSCEVVEVLGPNEALVKGLQLVDPAELKRAKEAVSRDRGAEAAADEFVERDAAWQRQNAKSFDAPLRLLGWSTRGMADKARWNGPAGEGFQLALIGASDLPADAKGDKSRSRRKPQRALDAVPADAFKAGLSEEQFADLLAKRGMGTGEFTALVERELRVGTAGAKGRVLAQLEAKRPATRPDADEEKPAVTAAAGESATTKPERAIPGAGGGWKSKMKGK